MLKHCLLLMFSIPVVCLYAQEDDNNIVIKTSRESYSFVKGNKDNPVKIKEDLSVHYLCNEYRTTVSVAEFYNDQVTLDDVHVRINGDKYNELKLHNDYYNSDGIFYSDARVCYFSFPLEKKGTTSLVQFEKTVLDPRYFTSIYFTEPYAIQQKEIILSVPEWMHIEIREYNFKGYSISKKVENKSGETIYTYTLLNAPALKSETHSPGPSFIAPHLLIMAKYAQPGTEKITYFNTLDDQYKWYRQLIREVDNDEAQIKSKTAEITKDSKTDLDKVKAIYRWVQDNIRYIAYEDGIAGFKPEKAQEVIRKKYGDCKGMGNLMAEMLKSVGLDGRRCWLGTNHIAYDYSTPSLGVDNHMICAWIYKGKTYFLDGTETYIGFEETAERIQGRQVLIEDGDKYILQHIPVINPLQNTSYEKRSLAIEGNNLVGKVTQTWKGENKEWMLTNLHSIKSDKQEDALKKFLSSNNSNYQISNLKIINLTDYNEDLKIEYDLLFKDAVSTFDKEHYIDLDNRKDFSQFKFDTSKRKLPYQFSFKDHIIFETEILLPANARADNLPAALKLEKPGYKMNGSYTLAGNKIIYRKEIQLKEIKLAKDQFPGWNSDVEKLDAFYNNQLTITH